MEESTPRGIMETRLLEFIKGMGNTFTELSYKTLKDGKERGITFCEKDGAFSATKPCTGMECSVELMECDGIKVGSFHTHPPMPRPTPSHRIFSATDFQVAIMDGDRIMCVSEANRPKETICVAMDADEMLHDDEVMDKLLNALRSEEELWQKRGGLRTLEDYYLFFNLQRANRERMRRFESKARAKGLLRTAAIIEAG